ncbi:putative ABC transporter permease protein YtcP [Spirochaetia bacterium]|nr:putative ABC transporter permease protein YtcP [Spirochaetia bacterium]
MRRSSGEHAFNIFNILLMAGLMIITLYPFLYVVFASFSEAGLLLKHRGLLLKPLGINFQAYRMVFKNPIMFSSYLNTIIYVVSGTSLSVLLTIFGAYSLSRKNVMLRMPITFFIIFTMWFSGGMIPLFLLIRNMHLLNSRLALILPNAVSAYNLIVTLTYFKSIPDSLEESAKIDGANDYIIMFRIIVPLAVPVISVITLFYSVSIWNAWFHAMIFLNKRELFPVQLVLREILILNDTAGVMGGSVSQGDQMQVGETIKYATAVVATIPILLVYPFVQKYFVKGVMIGAIKG